MQFLTRVPVSIKGAVESKHIARSMAYFPAVGLFLGILAGGGYFLLSLVLPGPVCDFIAIVFLVIITGNMHGDGLMDTADGIYSGRLREGMLEIMKDSRVGAHGATAGWLALLAKFILLGQLPPEARIWALVLMPVLGRWAQVYGAWKYPYVRAGGGTAGFAGEVGGREFFLASLTALAAIAGTGTLMAESATLTAGPLTAEPVTAWTLMAGAVLTGTGMVAGAVLVGTVLFGRYLSRKLGGITGDVLGALNECIEILTLFILLLLLA